jgi:hypothetical protein
MQRREVKETDWAAQRGKARTEDRVTQAVAQRQGPAMMALAVLKQELGGYGAEEEEGPEWGPGRPTRGQSGCSVQIQGCSTEHLIQSLAGQPFGPKNRSPATESIRS